MCLSQDLLTQQEGASFLLQGNVSSINPSFCTSEIHINNFKFTVTGDSWPIGQQLRLLIHASDVSLCLSKPVDSSILNIIPTTIKSISKNNNGKHLITLNFGSLSILSIISHQSLCLLDLNPGLKVYAQIKATAVIR